MFAEMTPYSGARWQRGNGLGGIFKTALRLARPFMNKIGKKALRAGLKGSIGLARDTLRGRNVKTAAKQRFLGAVADTLSVPPSAQRPYATAMPRRRRPAKSARTQRGGRLTKKRKRCLKPPTSRKKIKKTKTTRKHRDVFGVY